MFEIRKESQTLILVNLTQRLCLTNYDLSSGSGIAGFIALSAPRNQSTIITKEAIE